jgi:hypothetical protein
VLALAIYEIAIEKALNSEYWINVYHCDATDLQAARAIALNVIAAERTIHMDVVAFTKFRVKNISALGQAGTVYPIGQSGQVQTTVYMPLFVVARFDLTLPSGRPDRKYIRAPVATTVINNGQFTQSALNFYNGNYSTALLAITGLTDRSGASYTAVAVNPVVGMRQLRRGSRKRTTPVING